MSKEYCQLCGVPLSDDSSICKICKATPVQSLSELGAYDPPLDDLVHRKPAPSTLSRGAGLKFDSGKLRYSLIPPVAIAALAKVLTFGAEKYAPNSWQTVENGEERYLDALFRHIEAYRSGESIDPESGLSHLAHAACNVAFLLHFETERNR